MGWYKSLTHKVHTWGGFSPADRRCAARALWLMPLVACRLKFFGLRRTQAWLARTPPGTAPEAGEAAVRVRRTTQLVRVARRYHWLWTNCLSHTLTLWAMLRRQGVETDIRIGVRKNQGRAGAHPYRRGVSTDGIEAHAWLEWQGAALTDPGEGEAPYRPFEAGRLIATQQPG